jgi:hypothetical protein
MQKKRGSLVHPAKQLEAGMSEQILIRGFTKLLSKRVCTAGVYGFAACVIGALFTLDAGISSTDPYERERERALWQFQLREMERQADHRRLLELLEAIKPRRDLSLPSKPEEMS